MQSQRDRVRRLQFDTRRQRMVHQELGMERDLLNIQLQLDQR